MSYCNSSCSHLTVLETETEALGNIVGFHGIASKLKAMQLASEARDESDKLCIQLQVALKSDEG